MRFEYRWETRWRDCKSGGSATEWDKNLDFLAAFGAEGWELVCIVPRSSQTAPQRAGFTDAELWVFKRPLG